MVVNILIVPPLAFNQVLNALVGQALGSGNQKMAGTWLQLSIFFLSTTYVPFMVIQYLYVADILHLLGFQPDVCELAGQYARWNLFWPIPNGACPAKARPPHHPQPPPPHPSTCPPAPLPPCTAGIYQCMRFYFQAQGMPRPAMWNNLAFLGVNAFLNWVFVFGGPFRSVRALEWHGFGFLGGAMSISTSRCLQPLTYWLYMFAYRRAHRPTWPGLNLSFLRADRVRSFLVQALPLIGTLIFQSVSGQITSLLIAQLGSIAIAATSAVTAATQVVSSGLSAAFTAIAAVRIGFHLGRSDAAAAEAAMRIVVVASLLSSTLLVAVFWPLRWQLCSLVTNDEATLPVASTLVAAAFVAAGLSQLVSVATSGVLSGQGRTVVTTWLSFGFELPTSIGGTALLVYVAKLRGPTGLLWITWAGGGFSLVEVAVVGLIIACGSWRKYADEARKRQEASAVGSDDDAPAAAAAPSAAAATSAPSDGRVVPEVQPVPQTTLNPLVAPPADLRMSSTEAPHDG